MVALAEVIASNKRVATELPAGLVAVFVGGTSGVGEYTLKSFARYTIKPRVYIVGRSQEAANRILSECQQLNKDGSYEFIPADVSLLKNIDPVCRHIKRKESVINVLFQSQGNMAFTKTTSEGLPLASGIATHGRTRFILNLLPLLQNAAPGLRRVISVGAASYEGPIDVNNLAGANLSLTQWRDQLASMQTLLLEKIACRASDVSFIHCVPGVVKGGIMREMESDFKMKAMVLITGLLAPLINTSPEECAERHVFLATSARYPSRDGSASGVAVYGKNKVAKGSDGEVGSGMYTLSQKCNSSPAKVEDLLRGFRENGVRDKVWEYVKAAFLRITGSEVMAETL
ncbi:putative short-chain dehydrogenases/reductase [Periconia macrospinosa]|uniref:Putative short-chain dehydrogenases/reductase n=1 Tax=Periconia macrospinosa TaxID=97972 RepID=A0A2V1D8S2_9PLEO|nr:putative short-chain dehydrogenases/reductase [Periconia macrospinosa]